LLHKARDEKVLFYTALYFDDVSNVFVTEALKTSNIKTVLSILRTIDKERKLEYRRLPHISSTSNTMTYTT
jgi:hypothetical protein